MSNLYSERAAALDSLADNSKEAFDKLFNHTKEEAQLVATSVVYAGALIAAAIYRAMEKK